MADQKSSRANSGVTILVNRSGHQSNSKADRCIKTNDKKKPISWPNCEVMLGSGLVGQAGMCG